MLTIYKYDCEFETMIVLLPIENNLFFILYAFPRRGRRPTKLLCVIFRVAFYRTPVSDSPIYILTDGKKHAVPDTCRAYV